MFNNMLKKSLIAATLAAFAFGGFALAQQNPPVAPSPVKRTIISKIEMPGTNYEVLTAMLEIAPGFKAGRHFHPGIVTGYILEGEFWLALDGQPEKTYTAGQTVEVPLKAIHNEGSVGTVPVKAVITYVLEKGQPIATLIK
jgi:quercetin dioxygenase-like cupin family protein